MTLDEKVVLSAKISTIAEGRWLMKVRNKRKRKILFRGTHCVTLSKVKLVPFYGRTPFD